MIVLFGAVLGVALICALLTIFLGRNLTRSIAAGYASVTTLATALMLADGGFFALSLVFCAALSMATIQLFGWMLVDVDRDHLAPTDVGTGFARALAFAVFALAASLLAGFLLTSDELAATEATLRGIDPRYVGAILFGDAAELLTVLGFALAGALLSAILLLRDDGHGSGEGG